MGVKSLILKYTPLSVEQKDRIKGILGYIPRRIKEKSEKKARLKNDRETLFKTYNTFLKTGQTPVESYMALVNLYCASNGNFNEEFNEILKPVNPSVKIPNTITGVLGSYSLSDFNNVNTELNKNGYIHFDKKLSKELCKKIYDFALTTPATIPPSYDKKISYDPSAPLAEIYRFDILDLMNNKDIQQLMIDPVLLNIARNYLGCEPIFDFPAMWWSAPFQKEASSEAAQLYHFDMDRIKWLKIFIYVNDVTLENGPHCYIRGTHQPGAKPAKILERGYSRIKDEELHPYYRPEDIKIVCGEAGSIFAGDTKCWHKGTTPIKDHRLVLEFEYTSSLFGANIQKLEVNNYSEGFKEFCMSNKIFASNISFKTEK